MIKNHQASSQKFRQLISSRYGPDTIYEWKQLEKLNQKLDRMTNHLTFLVNEGCSSKFREIEIELFDHLTVSKKITEV